MRYYARAEQIFFAVLCGLFCWPRVRLLGPPLGEGWRKPLFLALHKLSAQLCRPLLFLSPILCHLFFTHFNCIFILSILIVSFLIASFILLPYLFTLIIDAFSTTSL